MVLGRKYSIVTVSHKEKKIRNITAFIDSGADLSIIGSSIAKRMQITDFLYERSWIASDGDRRYSPIVEIGVKAKDDRNIIHLDEVIVDDAPLDDETDEEIILGLDYLQKARKILDFAD